MGCFFDSNHELGARRKNLCASRKIAALARLRISEMDYFVMIAIALFPLLAAGLEVRQVPTPLDGRWAQSCQARAYRSEDMEGSQARYTENYFSDDGCTEPLLTIEIAGPFSFTEKSSGGGEIDFVFETVTAVSKHDLVTAQFNRAGACGWRDWKTLEPRDVTGLSCDFFASGAPLRSPSRGEVRYGIWKIEGTQLFFGLLERGFDGLSPQTRPQRWNPKSFARE